MSITSGRTTVGITPVQVDGNSVNPFVLYIHNESSTKTLYLGNGTVTVANGFGIDKSSVQQFTLFPGQSLFMVSESGDHIVSWLRIPV
jgi:hypothetical protein